jgi:competence ComEA-like helix-hairpin-helix protein
MSRGLAWGFAAASAALLLATVLAARPYGQSAGTRASHAASDEAGAALLTRVCGDCHEPAEIVEHRRTRADWQDILTKLIEKGATGTRADFEALLAYLCAARGEIHINEAAADEIAFVLGLSKRHADAIVSHRTSHGRFADFDALRKVPAIDLETLQARREAVVF